MPVSVVALSYYLGTPLSWDVKHPMSQQRTDYHYQMLRKISGCKGGVKNGKLYVIGAGLGDRAGWLQGRKKGLSENTGL